MSILTPRISYSPFEYDQAYKYWELQQQSHWLHYEINLSSDINDWKMKLSDTEKYVIGHILKGFTQSEIFIQEYWGQMVGKWFKKPEIQMMAAAFSSFECFDDQTELLTNVGWVKVDQITKNHQVAQYDLETTEITFALPDNLSQYKYKGKMHHYKGQSIDMCITPNHDLIVVHPSSRKKFKSKSENGIWGGNYLSPVSGKSGLAETGDLSWYERLMIAIQADGCIRAACEQSEDTWKTVDFDLTKPRKINRLRQILSNLNIKFSERPKERATIFTFAVPGNTDLLTVKSFKCFNLNTFSEKKAREFIEEVVQWDATIISKRKSFYATYYNTNKQAIDFVQSVAIMCGMAAHLGINRTAEQSLELILPNGKHPKTAKNHYALSLSKKTLRTLPHRKEIDYDGFVYCVSVPKQNVISRRNGLVVFTGNSIHTVSYAYLNQSLGLEDFDAFLHEPTAKAKIDRLITTKGKSKEEIARSLAIFSAFNEGVNLFSSFAVLLNFSRFNKLKGVGQIIAFSIKDESLHSEAGCWLFRTLISEFPEIFTDQLKKDIYDAARLTIELEDAFISKAFEKGEIEGISANDLKSFIRFRANTKLNDLGLKKVWKNVDKEAIERMEWFSVISSGTSHTDFFAGRVDSYARGVMDFSTIWDEGTK